MRPLFHGVYPVLATPFDEVGRLDLESLARLTQFVVGSGADGIVCNGYASEFTTLTLDERRQVAEAVRATASDTPVVVAVSAPAVADVLDLAKHAASIDASAVMAMPPFPISASEPELVKFYRALATRAQIPIIAQNSRPPVGTVMSVSLLAELSRALPHVRAIKEEAFDSTHKVSLLKAANPDVAVIGGEGGRFALNQRKRGSAGFMPASSLPDAHVAIWRALEEGDESRARTCMATVLPLVSMSDHLGPRLHKEILVARGVLRTATVRQPGLPGFDAIDLAEMRSWLDLVDAAIGRTIATAQPTAAV